ncbi:MAG TPA: hypothetical protein DCM87_08980 [Planctomycetes bacterium]|nr:hypothetical protein [Planctomycetota bacterium]
MILTGAPPIHPRVPLMLHPGVVRPAQAAAREALGTLYRLYAALEDSERLPADEWATAAYAVDECLRELRRALAYGGRWERAALRRTIARIERGRALVEERRRLERWSPAIR